jgi:hypothetical protein
MTELMTCGRTDFCLYGSLQSKADFVRFLAAHINVKMKH